VVRGAGAGAEGVTRAAARLDATVAELRRLATPATRAGLARYAIPSHHALAEALFQTGIYEARLVAAFVADPAKLTPAQMNRWCQQFDNWAYCDTFCFHLFDRSPHAWKMVERWSKSKQEFVKRTAFALLWSLSLHDKGAGEERFERGLLLVERAAGDDRHFVQKAVNMALRAMARRAAIRPLALALADHLADADAPSARSIGRAAAREIRARAKGRDIT
jgi:3-methyladenine DNA glycosylase AlkD